MEGELKDGRYLIEQKICAGGQGVVFRAHDQRLKVCVALKQIKPEHLHDSEFRRRLIQEIRIAAAINHPGIAKAMDCVDSDQESFVVYEWVEGVTLREELLKRSFTHDEILNIGIELADTLAAVHEKGFIHRDLKPENIMLLPWGESGYRVKILDFGVAKRVHVIDLSERPDAAAAKTASITGTTLAIVGTIGYMSPEQLVGSSKEPVDARTDIFSLGVVLYEMAAGRNPFSSESESDIETIGNSLMKDPVPLQTYNPLVQPELDCIVSKCLRKRREERYQTAHELQEALSRLRGQPFPVPPLPVPVPDNGGIPRGLARALFVLIQVGYLAMYTAALCFPSRVEEFLALFKVPYLSLMVLFSALCGAALRLYFVAAAALDYFNTGSLFRWMFPWVLVLDAAWAASPLVLFYKLGYPVLLMMAGLAYLPFSQRTLVSYAYAPRGGRISTSGGTISVQRP